jgi:hypothetical protein
VGLLSQTGSVLLVGALGQVLAPETLITQRAESGIGGKRQESRYIHLAESGGWGSGRGASDSTACVDGALWYRKGWGQGLASW